MAGPPDRVRGLDRRGDHPPRQDVRRAPVWLPVLAWSVVLCRRRGLLGTGEWARGATPLHRARARPRRGANGGPLPARQRLSRADRPRRSRAAGDQAMMARAVRTAAVCLGTYAMAFAIGAPARAEATC